VCVEREARGEGGEREGRGEGGRREGGEGREGRTIFCRMVPIKPNQFDIV